MRIVPEMGGKRSGHFPDLSEVHTEMFLLRVEEGT